MTYNDTFIRWSTHQSLTPSDMQYLAADKYTPHVLPPDFNPNDDTATHSIPTYITKEIVKRIFERSAIAPHAYQIHRLDLDTSNPPSAPIDIHFLAGKDYQHSIENSLLDYIIDSTADGIAGIIDQNFWDAENLADGMGVYQSDTPIVLFPNSQMISPMSIAAIPDMLNRYMGVPIHTGNQSRAWIMNKRSAINLSRYILGIDYVPGQMLPDQLMGCKFILNECMPDNWIVFGVPKDYVFYIDLYMGLSIYSVEDGWRYVVRLSYTASPVNLHSFVLSYIDFSHLDLSNVKADADSNPPIK